MILSKSHISGSRRVTCSFKDVLGVVMNFKSALGCFRDVLGIPRRFFFGTARGFRGCQGRFRVIQRFSR